MDHTVPFNLGDLYDRAQDPDKIALIDAGVDGHPREYTYREFEALICACARGLARRSLERGDSVAIAARIRIPPAAGHILGSQAIRVIHAKVVFWDRGATSQSLSSE